MERNVMGELNVYRWSGVKPNFSEIARRHGMDRHTVAKYWREGERSRLAAARAGHVRKRGQPCGRQRNVGSPRGPHLMVSTSMVYGRIIDVFNTEDISAECSGEKPRRALRIPCVYGLGVGVGGGRG